jgi:hypothetical protein
MKVILEKLRSRGIDVISSTEIPGGKYDPASLRASAIRGILINAEGALHGRGKHAVSFSQVAETSKEAGLPCFIANAVLDSCDREVIEKLRHVTKLYCREARSKAQADSLGVPAELCPDLTLSMSIPRGLEWTAGRRIVVTDSTVPDVNRALHGFAVRNGYSFLPLRGAPQITSYGDTRSITRALKFAVRSRGGRLFRGNFEADRYGCAVATAEQFIHEIATDTQLIITGRFHGVCLCLKVGVPFLAVRSNTHKVEGLLEDAGMSDRLSSMDELKNGVAVAERLARSSTWTEADKIRRCHYLELADRSIAACFDTIAAAVKTAPI